jgi:alkanesulfonate monooxygenase SsuD/methylene tetrahydromethanopterin reductase-like flavin-dependent oxidoreductase (luciferase family)
VNSSSGSTPCPTVGEVPSDRAHDEVEGLAADRLRVGAVAPDTAKDVRRLEAAGAESFWVGGHVASPNRSPEPMVWLARLVEQVREAEVGTATLLLPLFQPPVVAKQLADLDRASGGRLVIGVGVGGEYPDDFHAAGVPITERGARTNEAIGLLRRFWTGEPVDHDGTHFAYSGLRIHPAPSRPGGPPIVVTGRKVPAMRRAALLGDGWMPYLFSPDAYVRSVETITTLAAASGRDLGGFRWMAYIMCSLDDDPRRARKDAAEFLGSTYRSDFDPLIDRIAVTGDVPEVAHRLQSFVDAGARHLVLLPCQADRTGSAERLLAEVVPSLRVRS